jgi:hypothetical protein
MSPLLCLEKIKHPHTATAVSTHVAKKRNQPTGDVRELVKYEMG